MSFIHATMDMKVAYLDTQAAQRAIDAKTRRAMNRSLSWMRITGRRNLRRRKRKSRPGESPSVRSKSNYATLKNIRYGYAEATKSGVVGPIGLGKRQDGATDIGSLTVPQILEAGGDMVVSEAMWSMKTYVGRNAQGRFQKGTTTVSNWVPYSSRRQYKKPPRRTRKRRVTIKKRPNMATVLDLAIQQNKLATPWANLISN